MTGRRGAIGSEPLTCPSCATTHALSERFCPRCGMPLVYTGTLGRDQPVSARQERARKIKRQYSEGDLVHAAGARNQAEAEFIQGLLLEEGIPSLVRRSAGFDVPDFLAAGPRDVLVPQSGADAARDVLLSAEIISPRSPTTGPAPPVGRPLRLLAGLLAGILLVALILWVGAQVSG